MVMSLAVIPRTIPGEFRLPQYASFFHTVSQSMTTLIIHCCGCFFSRGSCNEAIEIIRTCDKEILLVQADIEFTCLLSQDLKS